MCDADQTLEIMDNKEPPSRVDWILYYLYIISMGNH